MDKKTVDKMLENAERKDFIEIISKISKDNYKAEKIIIDWCKNNNKNYQKKAIEIELEKLWKQVRTIISEFNEYGGGPESEEEQACGNLWKIDEIVTEYDISWELRKVILDETLEELNIGNSGFDDILMEVAESLCQNEEENRYLADVLARGRDSYYKGYAATIYKSIGDDEQFLKTKLNNLRYASDYLEVARFYAEQGNRKQELEYIWKGLEKSSGRLDELVDYIAPIYIKEKNEAELLHLYKFIMETKWDVNTSAMAKQMYQYSGIKGDYESEKKMLLLILDTCERNEIKKWFDICKNKLHEEDWQNNYEDILERVKKKDLKFYLDICMETGRENVVLKYLQDNKCRYDYWSVDCNQYFSKRLAEKYPNEILAIYWQDVDNLLCISNNKNYEIAAEFLKKIKALMKKNKRQAEWEEKFSELKEKHKRKRNFMALVGKL